MPHGEHIRRDAAPERVSSEGTERYGEERRNATGREEESRD
jgi:hypothetical protein